MKKLLRRLFLWLFADEFNELKENLDYIKEVVGDKVSSCAVDYHRTSGSWAVGRLIEIYHICVSRGFSFNVCFPNLMNEIMYKLAEANSNGWLDLKKLEE